MDFLVRDSVNNLNPITSGGFFPRHRHELKIPNARSPLSPIGSDARRRPARRECLFPKGDGPWPVILYRTPYGKGETRNGRTPGSPLPKGMSHGGAGLPWLWEIGRDLGALPARSAGRLRHAGVGGKQTWCNGNIGSAGGSYLGLPVGLRTECEPISQGDGADGAMRQRL